MLPLAFPLKCRSILAICCHNSNNNNSNNCNNINSIDNAFLGPLWARASFLLSVARCRWLCHQLCGMLPWPAPGPSQPHPQSCAVLQRSSSPVIGRVSVALAFNLCAACCKWQLPAKEGAHAKLRGTSSSRTARRCAVSLQFANVNVVSHTLCSEWQAKGYKRQEWD